MAGATIAPSRRATRRAISSTWIASEPSGRCGPCCSVDPTGRMTMESATRASYSGLVISCMSTRVAVRCVIPPPARSPLVMVGKRAGSSGLAAVRPPQLLGWAGSSDGTRDGGYREDVWQHDEELVGDAQVQGLGPQLERVGGAEQQAGPRGGQRMLLTPDEPAAEGEPHAR